MVQPAAQREPQEEQPKQEKLQQEAQEQKLQKARRQRVEVQQLQEELQKQQAVQQVQRQVARQRRPELRQEPAWRQAAGWSLLQLLLFLRSSSLSLFSRPCRKKGRAARAFGIHPRSILRYGETTAENSRKEIMMTARKMTRTITNFNHIRELLII